MHTRIGVWITIAALALMSGPESWAKKGGNGGGGGGPPSGGAAASEIVYADGGTIKVMDADGGNATTVFRAKGFSPKPSWSGDGTKIVFNATKNGAGIYIVNLDGTGLEKVATLASQYVTAPAWSPKPAPGGGDWILFEDRDAGGNKEIFAVRPDGTGRHSLTNRPSGSEHSAAWSPDATQFVAVVDDRTTTPTGYDVYIYTLGIVDGSLEVVTTENLSDRAGSPLAAKEDFVTPSWSRAGDHLAVSVDDGTWYDLWIVPVTAGATAPATAINITNRTAVIERFPSWAQDDNTLVYWRSAGKQDSGIYLISRDGSGETKLSKGQSPSWKR